MQDVARTAISEYVSDRRARSRAAIDRVRNHPLVDGDERSAWSATRVFCLLNGTDLMMDVDVPSRRCWPWPPSRRSAERQVVLVDGAGHGVWPSMFTPEPADLDQNRTVAKDPTSRNPTRR